MRIFTSIKKSFVFIFLVITILIAFGLGIWFGKTQVICEVCKPEALDFSLFWEAWSKLQEKYVDKAKFDIQKMIYGLIKAIEVR